MRHSGPAFELTGGPDEARIDEQGVMQISQALRDAHFDERRDSYQEEDDDCEDASTDLSTLSFSITRGRGNRNQSVILYTGCLGPNVPTERINAMIKAIDQVTGTGKLLEQRKQIHQPDGGAGKP